MESQLKHVRGSRAHQSSESSVVARAVLPVGLASLSAAECSRSLAADEAASGAGLQPPFSSAGDVGETVIPFAAACAAGEAALPVAAAFAAPGLKKLLMGRNPSAASSRLVFLAGRFGSFPAFPSTVSPPSPRASAKVSCMAIGGQN